MLFRSTCSGAYKFLLEHGVIPTHHVESDPRPHKAKMLGQPHAAVDYLVASIIHPDYLDVLEQNHVLDNTTLFHILFFESEILRLIPPNEWISTGGNTAGGRAIKLARMMGFTNHHYFGFDITTGYAATHLKLGSAQDDTKIAGTVDVHCNGKVFKSMDFWVEQAEMTFEDLDRMPEVRFQFHGEGLMQEMAKIRKPVKRTALPMGVYRDEQAYQCGIR